MAVCVKDVDNSVLSQAEDLVDLGTTESFLEKGLVGYFVYSATVGTSSKPFETPTKRAGDEVDKLVRLYWVGKGVNVWALRRKKGIEEVAFRPNYDLSFYTRIMEQSSNWADDIVEPELVENFRLASSDIVNRIKGFASLGDNWDSYGAKAIEWSTITKAIDFFSTVVSRLPDNAACPFVAPAGNGNIHFEWEMRSKVLKHSIPEDENDDFEYLLIDKTSGKVKKTYERALNMEEMADIALYWMS